MTRIQILSDLHLEFGPIDLPSVDRDILILAGDIHLGTKADQFILDQLKYSDVIYIMGNHEGYDNVLPQVIRAWSGPTTIRINNQARSLGYPGVLYFLENNLITIDDLTFIGATLWSDFDRKNPLTMNRARQGMNDFREIFMAKTSGIYGFDPGKIAFMPEDAFDMHIKSKSYIEEKLKQPGKKVIITHHLPSHQSISAAYRVGSLNGAYASNLDQLIYDYQPALWVHGHTHESHDYMIENTRIVCNPRGYTPNRINPNFKLDFVIEV